MALFKSENLHIKEKGQLKQLIKKENFESFNEDILGLGKIDIESKQVNCLSVMFDLEGFTTSVNKLILI